MRSDLEGMQNPKKRDTLYAERSPDMENLEKAILRTEAGMIIW